MSKFSHLYIMRCIMISINPSPLISFLLQYVRVVINPLTFVVVGVDNMYLFSSILHKEYGGCIRHAQVPKSINRSGRIVRNIRNSAFKFRLIQQLRIKCTFYPLIERKIIFLLDELLTHALISLFFHVFFSQNARISDG